MLWLPAYLTYTIAYGLIFWIVALESDRRSNLFLNGTFLNAAVGVTGFRYYNVEANSIIFMMKPFLVALLLSVVASFISGLFTKGGSLVHRMREVFPLVWTGSWFWMMVLGIAASNR